MRILKPTVVHASLVAIVVMGCGAEAASDGGTDLDGIPELGAVQMALTDDTDSEATTTQEDAVDPAAIADSMDLVAVPEDAAPSDLVSAQHGIRQLNQALRGFLQPIAKIVRETEPTRQLGALRVWGPVSRGDVEYRFLLRNAAAGRFAWRLDARPSQATGSYERIAVGKIAVGNQARRGAGAMGFDLDALGALNSDVTARGQILVGFLHGDAGTTVGYGLRNFTRDPGVSAGIDAVLRGVHLKDGFNRVRVAYRGDIAGTTSDAEEVVLARLRHHRDVGGRSDLLVLGGDVGSGQAWVRSQCWNATFELGFHEVKVCTLTTPIDLSACTVLESEGDNSACAASLRVAELPPSDPEAPMADEEDPNVGVEIPGDMEELIDPEME